MVLAGQRPEIIFEVCSRAIAFWTYQVHQEIMFQEYIATKSKERSTQLEKYYENILQKTKNELETMKQQQEANKKEVEAFKRKNAELSEKLKERVRQHQKLQTVYEALRRKFISPSYFEKQEHQKEILDKPQEPFMTSAASEIICQQSSKKQHKSKRVGYATTGDDFILRPVHTPTDDTSIDPGVLNFSSQGLFSNAFDNRNVPPKKHFT
ncbi:E3 ubiquitin-protein ligase CCNB1IP1-like [Uloborus diversus]|uniref:E3 ubiquitin-protein ligase CCNB1IP1-like n=1 Tax=Uloborus diversus TaxID=327109 RepID=UPI002409BC24|nr:E3 ubiquitin-protein ligase CCNB1IP1-like [Uloborus diversus]